MTTFYRMIPSAPPVDRASRNAQGWLPERATKYCDAATLASGWGHYLYAPMAFSVKWHKGQMIWQYGKHTEWFALGENGGAQFPGFSAAFDRIAPADLSGCAPPFLTALPEAGLLQIWTGYFVRTNPDESLWIGSPSNIPPHGDYLMFDGIVEADRYFSPVFANIRLRDDVVHFGMNKPLIQARTMPRASYVRRTTEAESRTLESFNESEWADYASMVHRKEGAASYALAARRRRKREDA
jgi:hypothetical protein